MRTEMQKKMDELAGLENVEFKLDAKTGKIVETGVINKGFDGEALEKSLPAYKQQVGDLEKQLEETQAKLNLCSAVEETEELKKFVELQKNSALLQQKKGLLEVVERKKEELQFHKDNLSDQYKMLKEWHNWKKDHEHKPDAKNPKAK